MAVPTQNRLEVPPSSLAKNSGLTALQPSGGQSHIAKASLIQQPKLSSQVVGCERFHSSHCDHSQVARWRGDSVGATATRLGLAPLVLTRDFRKRLRKRVSLTKRKAKRVASLPTLVSKLRRALPKRLFKRLTRL